MINEKEIKQFCKDAGYDHVKRVGLGATMYAFYTGSKLEWFRNEPFEDTVKALKLEKPDADYWFKLFNDTNSWLNKE